MSQIRIVHDHASGVVVHGTEPGEGTNLILGHQGHGLTWHRTREVWIMPGTRDRDPDPGRLADLAADLTAAGHTVAVTLDATRRPIAAVEADHAARTIARAARFRRWAAAEQARAEQLYATARAYLDHIPPDQPDLVDHHGYSTYRNKRDRALRQQDQAFEAQRAAAEWTRRAASTEREQSYRYNPEVIARRITVLETELRAYARDAAAYAAHPEVVDAAAVGAAGAAEDLAYWRDQLAAQAAAGTYRPWTREHFTPGDLISTSVAGDQWWQVVRVNPKTLKVDAGPGRKSTLPYDSVRRRSRDGHITDRGPFLEETGTS